MDELAATRRAMGKRNLPAGEAYTIELRRRYRAPVDAVWDALTSPDRLPRWLQPITGDLHPGGRFELASGEYGDILHCDPPQSLKVSWLYGPDARPGSSEVEVHLSPGPADDTDFELIHTATLDDPLLPTYGPGAGGVGWDLALRNLTHLFAGTTPPEPHEFIRHSAAAWGRAHLAAGGDPHHVAAAVEATTAFYSSGDAS
ncbi:hypothetical protein HPO96_09360 [Kribbella sandramycini]|uniref:Activator of Hsp90 ATPase homologue 1/2-like C-terminal domain-containing protein n=1 Tax=Kribbella sandramycini TaxID=60450 RepID=A0A7Y4KZ14_9ACTN|nr:hypothetical protein [Kribbella sandramycini]